MLPSEYLQKGWTRKSDATTSSGATTHAQSPNAVSWCLEGAREAAFRNQGHQRVCHIEYKLRTTVNMLIWEKINSNRYNILKRFLNIRKYNKTIHPITYWNDYDCRNQQEAIELMQEAEKIIGLTHKKMIPSQTTEINNIVNIQGYKYTPMPYVEKETIFI